MLPAQDGGRGRIYYTFRKLALAHKRVGQVLRFTAGKGFWLFGKGKPAPPKSPAMLMFDSIIPTVMPANAQAVAGYVNGNWPTFSRLSTLFPRAHRVSIDVSGAHPEADCLDVERGDATVAQAPGWYRAHTKVRKSNPIFYTSVSQAPGLVATLTGAGIPRSAYRLWTAHYNFKQHLCSSSCGYGNIHADATQFHDHYDGKNLDASVVSEGFFS